jgi:hypothetical protein
MLSSFGVAESPLMYSAATSGFNCFAGRSWFDVPGLRFLFDRGSAAEEEPLRSMTKDFALYRAVVVLLDRRECER